LALFKFQKVRGVNLPHRKHTDDSATREIPAPEVVSVPTTMHIGTPAMAIVQKGDYVCVGTKISEGVGFITSCSHSPVSGTVQGTKHFVMPDGRRNAAVIIENDGEYITDPDIAPPEVTDRESFVSAIKASGLVGLGGAGFPTFVKLMAPAEGKPAIDTLIINAAECEPYITADNRTMLEDGEDLKHGIEAVLRWCEVPACVIGIETNKPRAIEAMRELFKGDSRVSVKPLKCSYPQGAEKVLIANTVGRTVPMGGLPADVGVMVLNVTSAAFIGSYLRTGMPLISKRLTVDGSCVVNPGNYRVAIGTPIAHVLEEVGCVLDKADKLLTGGPMMGTAIYDPEFPIIKNNNAILVLSEKETGRYPINPCIRCGRCADGCPMGLSPVEIAGLLENKDIEGVKKLSVMNCMECGCCSFICPAGRPVTQTMRLAKAAVRKAGAK